MQRLFCFCVLSCFLFFLRNTSAPGRRERVFLCQLSPLWGHRVKILPDSPPCSLPTLFKHTHIQTQSPTHMLLLLPLHILHLHTHTHTHTDPVMCTSGEYLLIKNHLAVCRASGWCWGLRADWLMNWSKAYRQPINANTFCHMWCP